MKLFLMSGVLVVLIGLLGCSRGQSGGSSEPGMTMEDTVVAGIRWHYDESWEESHDMPMRVATYVVPSGLEDMDPGECAVYYFGKDQGGDVDENIQRWGTQFEGATEAQKTTTSVHGVNVVIARIYGTYLSPGGPDMTSQGKKPGYKLMGAIVSAPGGMVFFKFTAPAQVVERNEDAFMAMIQSIERE